MTIEEAIKNRKSVRSYSADKKVSKKDINKILEAGRLAPNGLSLEAWTFNVVENNLEKLMEAARGQKQVGEASFAIVLTAPTAKYIEQNPHILTEQLEKIGYPKDKIITVLDYLGDRKGNYVREQTFFAATQMMLQASGLNIGSNAIGGFDQEAVAEFLKINSQDEQVTLIITFGYENEKTVVKEKKILETIVRYY